jgi:intracellular septation protein A
VEHHIRDSLAARPTPRLIRASAAVPLAIAAVAIACLVIPSVSWATMRFIVPALVSIAIFLAFGIILYHKVGDDFFGEIGFVYMGFTMLYTIFPALVLAVLGLAEDNPISLMLPEPSRLVAEIWRQVLFQAAVAAGYLVLRGSLGRGMKIEQPRDPRDGRTVFIVAAVIFACLASLILMSGPVDNYWEHYTRFDHLSWLPRKFTSVALRLSLGLYCALLVFLFREYRKYRFIIPFIVGAICSYEIIYSYGARIQALIVLLQVVCLYHYLVKRITLKVAFMSALVVATFFSAIEVVRQVQGDISAARSVVSEEGLQPAGEFLAVFYPAYHLYEERAQGSLPPTEWPMFFNDAISLVTWGDYSRYNPMAWYTRNYYPDAEVAPFTLGPIAESAIWGGEWDLLFRGLVNGLFFAGIMRWFVRRRNKWWALVIYAYCFATAILIIKYSIFLHLTLIEKTILPTLLVVSVIRNLPYGRRSRTPDSQPPALPVSSA